MWPQARCSPEVVRVLVLYTPKAAQGRDIDGIIYAALNDANQAYRNSQINNLELRLIHKQQFSFYIGGNAEEDVRSLYTDSQAQALRDQYQADVVVLLIDSEVGDWDPENPDGRVHGVAGDVLLGSSGEQLINVGEVRQKAYAIVLVDFASSGDYTFTHEVGHIFGAQHDPEDGIYREAEAIPYARGHR
ncbi:zinc-dependent metalloprotease family protein, partial [Rhodothermus profundi]|uniref:zinc-dependent metalloprotease family protein n=1 Tax=Rhodothermus profundi TaxID=633813 RepID=UPI001FE9B195